MTGKTSKTGYNNWDGGDPNSGGGKENCVIMGSTGGWHDVSCQSLRSFVCYTGKKRSEFMDFTFWLKLKLSLFVRVQTTVDTILFID